MSDKLKSCPFCGKKPKWTGGRIGNGNIYCPNFLCPTSPSTSFLSKEEAIARWNRRAEQKGSDK